MAAEPSAAASVANITVTCMTNRFTIGGTISGLAGSGLQLRLNNEPPLDVAARATGFSFPSLRPERHAVLVRVARDPTNPAQRLQRSPTASGVVLGANVTNVAVTCMTDEIPDRRLPSAVCRATGWCCATNDGETLAIASNGDFFFRQFARERHSISGDGAQTPPMNPSQTCTVANASGTVGNGDVRNVRGDLRHRTRSRSAAR